MIEGKRKNFHDKSRLKEFATTKTPLQSIAEEYLRLKRKISISKKLEQKINNVRSVLEERKTKKRNTTRLTKWHASTHII